MDRKKCALTSVFYSKIVHINLLNVNLFCWRSLNTKTSVWHLNLLVCGLFQINSRNEAKKTFICHYSFAAFSFKSSCSSETCWCDRPSLYFLYFLSLVPRSGPRNLRVFDETTNSLSVQWDHADGPVQQYRIIYSPTVGDPIDEYVSAVILL